jgi:hypothetical protein
MKITDAAWICGAAGRSGMGKSERRGTRRDGQNECQSGLLERPPWDLLPGIRAKPIIAAKERELRETIRARMNIGFGGRLPILPPNHP